jgi:hypothetical protein
MRACQESFFLPTVRRAEVGFFMPGSVPPGGAVRCEELASFPNGGKPLSGGTGIVTCDEIDDVEQV